MSAPAAELAADYLARPDNRHLDQFPGAYGLPYLGYVHELLLNPHALIDRHYRRYGPLCRTRLTGQRLLWALGPEFNREVTTDPRQLYSARMGYDGPLRDFFAGGLLMRDFAEHRLHRRLMMSAFRTESARVQIHQVNALCTRHIAAWGDQPAFLFYPAVKKLLLDIAARVFLGLNLESDIERVNTDFLKMMAGVLAIVRKDWPGFLYGRAMAARRSLADFIAQQLPIKRSTGGDDIMSEFVATRDDDGQPLPDQVVIDHMLFLLLAAHDTTTSAMTMAAYYLAADQDLQEQLREEARGLPSNEPGYEDARESNRLERIDCTFNETLRLHPPVPQLMRRLVRDAEVCGHAIPADTLIAISPVFTHRMPEYWREPHRFDPSRFAPERAEHKAHSHLFIPFGGGMHKCIGMHFADLLFKCAMPQLLRRYRWTLANDYRGSAPIVHFPFAKLRDDLPLRLQRIN
jgi:cytochrome P450